ncbi:MAG: polyprenyl synthetase family protein [Oscillospiraceae bacterium]|jgi:farnesyl diphosphate synthase|nr:polyprenyl synthetase family protein [Oscillospiraceae bacterium]
MDIHELTLFRYKSMIELELEHVLPEIAPGRQGFETREMLRYAALDGGKRLRGAMTLAWGRAAHRNSERSLQAAAAIELLHAYTLVHDDLPEMDNSATRRGKPSLHAKFGHWQALLAGDLLQATAFDIVAKNDDPGDIKTLAWAAKAVCEGQYLDLSERSEEEYALISRKTGALFAAACKLGSHLDAAFDFGLNFGIAFQLADDLRDGDGAVLTFGEEKCRRLVARYVEKAKGCTSDAFLLWLAEKVFSS